MKKLIFALLLVLLLITSCKNVVPPKAEPDTAALRKVLDLVNEARAKPRFCGKASFPAVPKLSYNGLLAKAAQNHSEDMAATNIFSHKSPVNSKHYSANTEPIDRIRQEGYQPIIIRENIARGQHTAKEVVDEWLASPSHCESIMGKLITETGLGHSGNYWTQDFAKSKY